MTKYFYRNGKKENRALKTFAECTRDTTEAKKKNIIKMNNKLEDTYTFSKTYWIIYSALRDLVPNAQKRRPIDWLKRHFK